MIHHKNNAINKYPHLFSTEATTFVTELVKKFGPELKMLLVERKQKQDLITKKCLANELPLEFIDEAIYLKEGEDPNWKGPKLHPKLTTRHVEITGPASQARMVFNSFQCGADVYMSDFEDSLSPTSDNIIQGQINLYEAVRKTLKKDGKSFEPTDTTLVVRARGLHLKDHYFLYDNQPSPGCLIDFGYFFYNNAKELLNQESGPFFYLPKMEHWEEAAWWASVFKFAEDYIGIEQGSIRATVLIETLPAVFEMDAIIYALKDYCAGLNCGRWDYIFSYMKTLKASSNYVLPDRKLVGMSVPFMRNYSLKLIETCHKRGIHAMGGMSANVPYKIEENKDKDYYIEKNNDILDKIVADKQLEADNGHDGAWSAHPQLVPVIKKTFEKKLQGKSNQIDYIPNNSNIMAKDMLIMPEEDKKPTTFTEEGLKTNINVGLQYVIAWLNGVGAVGINYQPEGQRYLNPRLMEDLATAEISRSQIFQWWKINQPIMMADGTTARMRDIFQPFFEYEKQRIKENSQIVKYNSTPHIEHLKNKLLQTEDKQEQNVLKNQINQEQNYCKQQFELGCKLFHQMCTNEKEECLFFPDLGTRYLK